MKAFGKYENLSLIGSGATADVYLAQDKTLARPVALKVLKASLVSDAQSFERFLLEARSAANLFHPNIATVLDMGETEGRFYIAMRYYEGQSLQERLAKEGRLSWDETLRLAEQIGSALDYAHEQGLLHRDVKPSNILCTQEGDFVLTDFGLTRAMMNTGLTSHTGAILGTPAYIAPEIWAGRAASPATDQYSLACVLAECLSGERLFQGDTPPEIMTRHMLDGPQFPGEWPGGVPGEVGMVLERALDRKADSRYPDCGVLAKIMKQLEVKQGKTGLGELKEHKPAGQEEANQEPVFEAAEVEENPVPVVSEINRPDSKFSESELRIDRTLITGNEFQLEDTSGDEDSLIYQESAGEESEKSLVSEIDQTADSEEPSKSSGLIDEWVLVYLIIAMVFLIFIILFLINY